MKTGKAQSAVNVLRRLKMIFNWATDRDLIPTNPCERIRPPAKTVERDRVLSDREISAVWQASFELSSPFGEMYRMLMLTGQRRTEVSTMRWSEVDEGLWTIPREKVKKDRPHTVPLSATSQALLSSLAERPRFGNDGFIFSTTGGATASSNFWKIKLAIDKLSGTSGWTIHDIRRTVRSKLAELGVPREVARKVLNHEDGKVDRIYNRHEYPPGRVSASVTGTEIFEIFDRSAMAVPSETSLPGGCYCAADTVEPALSRRHIRHRVLDHWVVNVGRADDEVNRSLPGLTSSRRCSS